MLLYLDRFEGDYCVFVCNGYTLNIPKVLLPDAKEGDNFQFLKSDDKTNKTKNEELVKKLFK